VLIVNANIALGLGIAATLAKAVGLLPSVSWLVVTWPLWGTVISMFLIGFAERCTGEPA
jgi:hypothetical protein